MPSEDYQQLSNQVKRQVAAKKTPGVYKMGNNRFRAQYVLNGITKYVGTWDDEETAILEREKARNEAIAKERG